MKIIKGFTGSKYWEHKNPAYKKACFNKASMELIELKTCYDFFIEETVNKKKHKKKYLKLDL